MPMRKILSQIELEKKRKRNTAILSIFMLVLLLVSTLSYAVFSNPSASTNEEAQQTQQTKLPTDKISFQYQGIGINLISTYMSIENIPVDISLTPESYLGGNIYIESDNQGILQELASTIGSFSRLQEACYGKCEENLPEKTCDDNLIVWKESAENKVYQENNCVFIEGDISAADAFIYKLFNQ